MQEQIPSHNSVAQEMRRSQSAMETLLEYVTSQRVLNQGMLDREIQEQDQRVLTFLKTNPFEGALAMATLLVAGQKGERVTTEKIAWSDAIQPINIQTENGPDSTGTFFPAQTFREFPKHLSKIEVINGNAAGFGGKKELAEAFAQGLLDNPQTSGASIIVVPEFREKYAEVFTERGFSVFSFINTFDNRASEDKSEYERQGYAILLANHNLFPHQGLQFTLTPQVNAAFYRGWSGKTRADESEKDKLAQVSEHYFAHGNFQLNNQTQFIGGGHVSAPNTPQKRHEYMERVIQPIDGDLPLVTVFDGNAYGFHTERQILEFFPFVYGDRIPIGALSFVTAALTGKMGLNLNLRETQRNEDIIEVSSNQRLQLLYVKDDKGNMVPTMQSKLLAFNLDQAIIPRGMGTIERIDPPQILDQKGKPKSLTDHYYIKATVDL